MKHALVIAACAVLLLSGCKGAKSKPEWGYAGDGGPAFWGDLDPDFALAQEGTRQSPIDIEVNETVFTLADPPAVTYGPTAATIVNTGRAVQVDCGPASTLTVDGRAYALEQFHFHAPSEHTIDGRHAPAELHLVHRDAESRLAVLAVLIEEGAEHPLLGELWESAPAERGAARPGAEARVDASQLLPASLGSFRYSGSLTTPPCTEGVAWIVLREPIRASAAEIAALRRVHDGNNRPTQPLNGRTVTASD